MADSEFSRLADAILGDPEQRRNDFIKASEALGPPDGTFSVREEGDDVYYEYGVWRFQDGSGVLVVPRNRRGLYDVKRAQRVTAEQVACMAEVFNAHTKA